MSLRNRVLIGMGLIAVVLGVAAAVITRITEAHLVGRVDRTLETSARPFADVPPEVLSQRSDTVVGTRCTVPLPEGEAPEAASPALPHECSAAGGAVAPDGSGGAGGAGPTDGSGPTVGLEGELNGLTERLNQTFVAGITVDGMTTIIGARGEEALPPLDIDVAEARERADAGEAFTVGTRGSEERYRVHAVVNESTGGVTLVYQSLKDVDAAIDRLIAVETMATLAIMGALGLVAWWVLRHGIRPIQRMTTTATTIAAGDLSHRVPDMAPGTEAHQLGVALNQMLARIEQAFDERTRSEGRLRQFVADASHELRTPVTTIRGYTELYETGGLEDEAELSEAMRRTRQEAVRMGNLVDDMLLLARLDQGRPLDRRPVDVAAVVRDAGRDARAVAPGRVVITEADGPLVVLGDADRLRQVVANLVGNALVHTQSRAPLAIRARREGDQAVVEVADEGDGMPPEVARQAFERFFRADPSRSRHRGGSGLGLSIVQATVQAHGGRVTLDSEPGQGTTVRVVVPLAAPDTNAQL
jgi:two-component system OmpR family sensor kinase